MFFIIGLLIVLNSEGWLKGIGIGLMLVVTPFSYYLGSSDRESKIRSLEYDQANLESRLDEFEIKTEELNEKIEELETKLEEIDDRTSEPEEENFDENYGHY